MNNIYRNEAGITSLLRYHIVFCPRYRRKIFRIEGVREQFESTLKEICNELNINIIYFSCEEEYVYLFLDVPSKYPIHEIIRIIKSNTSKEIRKKILSLKGMPSIWTRAYFISTAGFVSEKTVKEFVRAQKKRS